MERFLRLLLLLCIAPAFHTAPQLPCLRSRGCKIQYFKGCYVVEGMCHCAQARCCNNPFNYSSLDNCLAIEENTLQFEDPCESNPCKNNGYCVQLSGAKYPGYRCECHGTGYFGESCYEKCPKDVRKAIHKLSASKAKSARQRIINLLVCWL